jgi:hypothetical protein
LLLLQVLLPFVVVSCMLRTVQVVVRTPLHALIILISMLSSLMGLVRTHPKADFTLGAKKKHFCLQGCAI